ncbi:hypothetical protein [Anaeromyxobacter oryzisoli]|jgi:hypothetical protein|uniref:hypothetical protein n=1 Tax=Anaeromyxobacter oryzisoli TaxID=2925408 RepID=UPI001F563C11|nr:hypothetical protein [Anaeromyxobacter sp. SG63]
MALYRFLFAPVLLTVAVLGGGRTQGAGEQHGAQQVQVQVVPAGPAATVTPPAPAPRARMARVASGR